jgi:RNA polymerase sigma-70 factor (ECF subfamily)
MSDPREAHALPPDATGRLSALFEAHADRLYRIARRLVSSADDALDLVQETLLNAARSAGSIPSGFDDERAWLVRVLVNIRHDQWRKETVRRRHRAVLDPIVRHEDPEEAFVIRSTVWDALDGLPPRRRAVVVMAEIEGLSVASIASLLGVPPITVRWHLSRGRRELATRLEPLPVSRPSVFLPGFAGRTSPMADRKTCFIRHDSGHGRCLGEVNEDAHEPVAGSRPAPTRASTR